MPSRVSVEELLALALRYAAESLPGCLPVELIIRLADGRKVRHPLCVAASSVEQRSSEPPPFVPTPVQAAILEALDGVAMRTKALGQAIHDERAIFRRPGGIQELRDLGLVDHHARLGYYRTDAPPEALQPAD